ncbi:MAG: formylglycine-generating enzyme family protein [Thermomicrobiales bacterium]
MIVDQPAGGVPVSESLTALPETQRNNGMVVVPAGDFVMGGDPLNGTERGRVVFVAEFMIDRTEATNAAFAEFVLQTGYRTVAEQHADARSWRAHAQQDLATHPVVYIAWEDAIAYCEHVGKRLPSESEWEKAARGSEAWMWPWGNDWDEMRANSMERGKVGTTPVGAFPMGASPYGLVDMAGNVWEWTMSSYTESLSDDPSDREVADELFRDHRVLRGGSWRTMALGTQAMYRKPAPVDYRRDTTGFRCAKNVP